MAKRKPQFRFVAEVGGQQMRLFSVRERTDGGLNVTTHLTGAFDIVGSARKKIKELKHSIHPTENSPGNQGHLTTNYWDGSKNERHLFTMAVANKRFQPVYRRTVYKPEQVDILNPHQSDTIVSVGKYDPAQFTLHYALWFAGSDIADSLKAFSYYATKCSIFEKFHLLLAYCYTNAPAPAIGYMVEGATYRNLTPKQQMEGFRRGVSEGERPELTAFRIGSDFIRLINREPLDPPIPPQLLPQLIRYQPHAEA